MVSFSQALGSLRSSLPVCACARITCLCVSAMHCRLPYERPWRIGNYAIGVIEIALRTGLHPFPREVRRGNSKTRNFHGQMILLTQKKVTL